MTTTIEKPPEDTPATAEADEPLPEYAAAVSELGDPQPTIDELTADLDAQTPPVIDPDPDAGNTEKSAGAEDDDSDA